MAKKLQKTTEEKTAEGYFPVDETDLKHTTTKEDKEPIQNIKRSIEKIVKSLDQEQEIVKGSIEKQYKKQSQKQIIDKPKRTYKKRKKSKTATKKYSPPKFSLKKNGYELIITEKPQAALKISAALGNSTKLSSGGVPHYKVNRDGKEIIVACAVGHLFTLKQTKKGSYVPIFDVEWTPNYLARKKDFTKKYYDTLLKLAKEAGSLTVATDYDVEGEVIGLNIVKYLCSQKDASRMKFSTLTNQELNKAYEEKSRTLNWGQAIAGETRHYLDWFYGINLSRALMNSIKTTGKFRIMSIGRVQGPALNLIVQKEREIQKFKPEDYWQIFITVESGRLCSDSLSNKPTHLREAQTNNCLAKSKKIQLELQHNKDIFNKSELKKFENLKGKKAIVETKKTEQTLPPQPPFNLTTLQTEAYKFYGIKPSRTLQIAQSLYLAGLISYPRTSSQKLPPQIGYEKILKQVAKKFNAEKFLTRKKPIEGKKSDPAHPSIYPTGNFQVLAGQDEKIYNLIAQRFLALFCDNAIINKKTVLAMVDNLKFAIRGSSIKQKGWMQIYPSKLRQNQIPDIEGEVEIIDSRIDQKQTQPPKRYSPASILSELEKRNLGTKATRASILETLYDRNYIKDTSVKATPLGMSLIATMEKYSPIIIDEKLTRQFEQKMDSIREAKKDYEKKETNIINEAKNSITNIAKDFEKSEKKIGTALLKANLDLREEQRIENTLIKCPKCNKGNLAITYSRQYKRQFIACNAYPKCKTTFSLPPGGIIKKVEKICEKCGYPLLMRLMKGKKPWIFCFNPECETNKERIESYKEKKNVEKEK